MNSLTLAAPAKINFLLDVIQKRTDGYHDLRMIMQRINLCDEITLTLTDTPEINVTCDSKEAPDGSDNIAWKAANALLGMSQSNSGAHITIVKKIPVAAGLGGGSSDAASVLMGMNLLLKLGLTDRQLMEIGSSLGADVPFFIFKHAALAEGIGNILTPILNMPNCWILLINPGIHISTAWVYRSLQLTNHKELNKLPKFFNSIESIVSVLSNDLEAVTVPAFPVIADIKAHMKNQGAKGSMMSGSGSTVFGIFTDFHTAEMARHEITRNTNWFSATVETI